MATSEEQQTSMGIRPTMTPEPSAPDIDEAGASDSSEARRFAAEVIRRYTSGGPDAEFGNTLVLLTNTELAALMETLHFGSENSVRNPDWLEEAIDLVIAEAEKQRETVYAGAEDLKLTDEELKATRDQALEEAGFDPANPPMHAPASVEERTAQLRLQTSVEKMPDAATRTVQRERSAQAAQEAAARARDLYEERAQDAAPYRFMGDEQQAAMEAASGTHDTQMRRMRLERAVELAQMQVDESWADYRNENGFISGTRPLAVGGDPNGITGRAYQAPMDPATQQPFAPRPLAPNGGEGDPTFAATKGGLARGDYKSVYYDVDDTGTAVVWQPGDLMSDGQPVPEALVGTPKIASARRVPQRYMVGDQWKHTGMSPEWIAQMQRDLVRAGMLTDSFRIGYWDDATAGAYAAVLGHANVAGVDERAALDGLISATQKSRELVKEQAKQQFIADPELLPDTARLQQSVIAMYQDQLGRDPRADELKRAVADMRGDYHAQYLQETRSAEQMFNAQVEQQMAAEDPMQSDVAAIDAFLGEQGIEVEEVDEVAPADPAEAPDIAPVQEINPEAQMAMQFYDQFRHTIRNRQNAEANAGNFATAQASLRSLSSAINGAQ